MSGLQCSFCGKHQGELNALITGPAVNICDECVGHCAMIVINAGREGQAQRWQAETRKAFFRELWGSAGKFGGDE